MLLIFKKVEFVHFMLKFKKKAFSTRPLELPRFYYGGKQMSSRWLAYYVGRSTPFLARYGHRSY